MPNVAGKVVIITGASSGIGEDLVRRFVKDGAKVALLARRTTKLTAIVESLTEFSNNLLPITCDVSEKFAVRTAVQQVIEKWGVVDIVIANAGISMPSPAWALDTRIIEKSIGINFLGALYTFEAAIPEMMKRRSGHLVAIASLAGLRGLPEAAAYCSSKSALISATESFRMDLKRFGIAVTTINPGFIKTPMTDRNLYWMPFIMSLEKAGTKIYTAILNRRKIVAFPFPLSTVLYLARFFPAWLYDLCLKNRRNSKREN